MGSYQHGGSEYLQKSVAAHEESKVRKAGVVWSMSELWYEASGKYGVMELLSLDCVKDVAILTFAGLQV